VLYAVQALVLCRFARYDEAEAPFNQALALFKQEEQRLKQNSPDDFQAATCAATNACCNWNLRRVGGL